MEQNPDLTIQGRAIPVQSRVSPGLIQLRKGFGQQEKIFYFYFILFYFINFAKIRQTTKQTKQTTT